MKRQNTENNNNNKRQKIMPYEPTDIIVPLFGNTMLNDCHDIIGYLSKFVKQGDFKKILCLNSHWKEYSRIIKVKSKHLTNEHLYSDTFEELEYLDLSDNQNIITNGLTKITNLKTLIINSNIINDNDLLYLKKLECFKIKYSYDDCEKDVHPIEIGEYLHKYYNGRTNILLQNPLRKKINITGQGLKLTKLKKLSIEGNVPNFDFLNLKNSIDSLLYLNLKYNCYCRDTDESLRIFHNLETFKVRGQTHIKNLDLLIENFVNLRILCVDGTTSNRNWFLGNTLGNTKLRCLEIDHTDDFTFEKLGSLSNTLECLTIYELPDYEERHFSDLVEIIDDDDIDYIERFEKQIEKNHKNILNVISNLHELKYLNLNFESAYFEIWNYFFSKMLNTESMQN
jgi:hypothetical protein